MSAFASAAAKPKFDLRFSPQGFLNFAARFWFCTAVAGQLMFVFEVASFYGRAALRGNPLALNSSMTHGYIPGQPVGNLVVAVHLAMAVLITLAGALQLMPQVRRRAPVFHRWLGRFYIAAAFVISVAGLYMMWTRGVGGDLAQNLGTSINALLIMFCAVMALRYAVTRNFATHRRWALRLFIVVGGVWFLRVSAILTLMAMKGLGDDPSLADGAVFSVLSYLQYLLPLAVLELYLRTQDHPGALRRVAMAAGLSVLTLIMGVGIAGATMAFWLPNIEAAYANRPTLDETLSTTIVSKGVQAAVLQYQNLEAEKPARYDFNEDQLNNLGYEFLRAHRFGDAIRILQLNAASYPRSANTYDSLGEAYMDAGDTALAITNYKESLVKNPKNYNAVAKLRQLDAPR